MLKSRGRVTLAAQVQARQGIVRGALKPFLPQSGCTRRGVVKVSCGFRATGSIAGERWSPSGATAVLGSGLEPRWAATPG